MPRSPKLNSPVLEGGSEMLSDDSTYNSSATIPIEISVKIPMKIPESKIVPIEFKEYGPIVSAFGYFH